MAQRDNTTYKNIISSEGKEVKIKGGEGKISINGGIMFLPFPLLPPPPSLPVSRVSFRF